MGRPKNRPHLIFRKKKCHTKKFRVQIFAYQMHADFNITCIESPIDIENAIIDRLGKSDIKWEYLGEMNDPKIKRITYEEVIDGEHDATSKRPLHSEEGSWISNGSRSILKRVDILSIWLRLTEKSEK